MLLVPLPQHYRILEARLPAARVQHHHENALPHTGEAGSGRSCVSCLDALPSQREQLVRILPSLKAVHFLHISVVECGGILLRIHYFSELLIGIAILTQ